MNDLLKSLWAGRSDFPLVLGVLGILVILFAPIPPALLDLLLILNLSTALLILLVTFYTETPLKFSTFPSLLLIATLFRLALNVTTTRMILDGAYAGQVINAVGSIVIGGNYIVGFVVFLILVVVQYVVVTNGAQRVAEVAARFTLDSMPGKQMSIDADMNMGLIDDKEARRRREQIEKEANFYGAMDGASKFVKGDAIAGIIIIAINIIGGLAIGLIQRGMSWADAAQHFTLLTVGDGIVTQIPSLIIAVATGIIITRAATDAQLGREISSQLAGSPRNLLIVAGSLAAMLVLPGLPKWPVATVLVAALALAWWAHRNEQRKQADSEPADQSTASQSTSAASDDFYRLLKLEPLELRLGRQLHTRYAAVKDTPLSDQVRQLRRQFAQEWGLVLPTLALHESASLADDNYEIWVEGSRVGAGELSVDEVLAINPGSVQTPMLGRETKDPAYGLPAVWISPDARQLARGAGYTLVDPQTVLMTHLAEVFKRKSAELLSRSETERMLDHVRSANRTLVDELVPAVLSLTEVQRVLQQLLREQVSLRGLETILEVLIDAGKLSKQPEELVEKVRERIGATICQRLLDPQGELHVMTLAPDVERSLSSSGRISLTSDIEQMDAFLKSIARNADTMASQSRAPVLLCPPPLRRPLRALLQRALPHVAVLSVNEVPSTTVVRTAGSVSAVAA